MILELDLGNTCWKWRLLAGSSGAVTDRGSADAGEWLAAGFPPGWEGRVRRIRAASVVGVQAEEALAAALATRLGITPEFARAASECAGVCNGYADPSRLGVDRWLMMLAAFQECRAPVLVVSAGSALTIDVVDRQGMHCGGYIIPGRRLMAEALLRDTARVRFAEKDVLDDLRLGRDTGQCVHNGIAVALAGAVELAWRQAEAMLEDAVTMVVAGGDGETLASNLGSLGARRCLLRRELVLDGLRWALP